MPLIPALEGERANRQNETGDADGAVEAGAEETFGQGDGGARDQGRTETEADGGVGDRGQVAKSVPLMLGAEGERANRQNAIVEISGAIEEGGEASFGVRVGGAEDPLRTEECVSLTPSAEEERANHQNETVEPTAGDERLVARQEAEGGRAMGAPTVAFPAQTAGAGLRERVSKRERKRMREGMKFRELERGAGRKRRTDNATDLEKIKSIEWLFPNAAKVLRQHR